jgi:branched-subunit amino acid transport protein
MSLWSVLILGLGIYLLRIAGLTFSPQALAQQEVIGFVPPAIIAGLVAMQTLTLDGQLVLDARLPGVLVACCIAVLRGPLIFAVLGGMATTALVRLAVGFAA